MKIYFRRLPTLFDLIFLIVTVLQSSIILFVNPHITKFIPIYIDAMSKVWWLGLVAIVFHIIGYLLTLDTNSLLLAHLFSIVAYIILVLLPNLLLVAFVLLVVSLVISLSIYRIQARATA